MLLIVKILHDHVYAIAPYILGFWYRIQLYQNPLNDDPGTIIYKAIQDLYHKPYKIPEIPIPLI